MMKDEVMISHIYQHVVELHISVTTGLVSRQSYYKKYHGAHAFV